MDILRTFADAHGIAFPLLSDHGSHVMRRLGLINERVAEDHAVYGIAANPRHAGLPYPGAFALDTSGVITVKRFHESYRERDTGTGLIAEALGLFDAPSAAPAVSAGDAVRVRAWLDSPTYTFFQRLRLEVELTVAPGWHVYGAPGPDGLAALSVEVAPIAGLDVGPAAWPTPRRLEVEGGEAPLPVHDGVVRGSLPLTFTGLPGAGDQALDIRVTYQACSATVCLPPAVARLTVPVSEVGLVGRPLPPPARS